MTEHPSPGTVAYLHSEHSVAQVGAVGPQLLELFVSESGRSGDSDWWLHVEQSDGYLVGRRRSGDIGFDLTGTTELDPRRLFDARVFSADTELRFAPAAEGGVHMWRHTLLAEDPRLPGWLDPARVAPMEELGLLVPPYARVEAAPEGFAKVRYDNGQEVILPLDSVDDAGLGQRRLRIRRHFSWDESTGRVWVEQECLAGYTKGVE